LFDGHAVSIPAEAPLDVAPFHSPVTRYDVFDCGGEEMPVVRCACCKGWAIAAEKFVSNNSKSRKGSTY
jgi:hypothetical protein